VHEGILSSECGCQDGVLVVGIVLGESERSRPEGGVISHQREQNLYCTVFRWHLHDCWWSRVFLIGSIPIVLVMYGASRGVISYRRGSGLFGLASGHGYRSDRSGVRCYRGHSMGGIVWRCSWEDRNNFGAGREVLRSSEGG